MSLVNIAGRAIADAMVKFYDKGDGSGTDAFFFKSKGQSQDTDFYWRVNREDLKKWEIKKEDLLDIVDQITEKGPVQGIKDELGILPNQGFKNTGLSFRSRTNSKIVAQVVFTDITAEAGFAPNYWDYHNRNNDYGQDAYLYFYYDIHHSDQVDPETEMDVLMYGGMSIPSHINV